MAFQYVEVSERPVRLGFCASPSSADCQAAVDSAIAPASTASKPDKEGAKDAPSAPSKSSDTDAKTSPFALKLNEVGVRSAAWQSADPPADVVAMQATVYRMWPPAEAPFDGGATAGGDDTQPAPRELGKVPGTPAAGAPPARIDAPGSPSVAGFIFSIPPQ